MMCMYGKMHLVDLAGSERVSLSVEGPRCGKQNINLSLAMLGNVLSALSKFHSSNNHHLKHSAKPLIPYRDSKLTYLLKDSLGGTQTVMLTAVRGPEAFFQQ